MLKRLIPLSLFCAAAVLAQRVSTNNGNAVSIQDNAVKWGMTCAADAYVLTWVAANSRFECLPGGAAAGTVTTSGLTTGAMVKAAGSTSLTDAVAGVDYALPGVPPTPGYQPNQTLSGCGVEYVSALVFNVGACTYTIAGVTYTIATTTTKTLAVADPSLPRIDLIGVDTSGAVFVTTGTPAASPSAPAPDASTQLSLTIVTVAAGATSPTAITVTSIYEENTEWTSAVTAHFNAASTSNPYRGTKDIEATAAVLTNSVTLVKPASGTEVLTNYNNLILYIRSKAAWPTGTGASAARSLAVFWLNGSTQVGSQVILRDGTFGFSSSNTSAYQQISIPVALFGTGGSSVTSVKFQIAGNGGSTSIGFYLDAISLQGGVGPTTLPATLMNFKGAWSSTKAYVPNDTVTSGGNGYVALVANTNVAVSTSSTWAALGTGSPSAYTTVTFSATPTFDVSLGNSFLLTLTGNVTSSTLSNASAGKIITLTICQDGSGSHTFVPPATVLNMGTIRSTASSCSTQTFVYDGSNAQALGALLVTGIAGGFVDLPGSVSGTSEIVAAATGGGVSTLPSGAGTLLYATGNAATASALDHVPTPCSAGSPPTGIIANGDSTGCAAITDAQLSTSDVTTNDVSTAKHGFAPKAPGDATKFLNGANPPAWTVPAGSGGSGGGGWLGYSGAGLTVSGTQYFPIVGGGLPSSTETDVDLPAPSAATISNFYAESSVAVGAGTTLTITFRQAASNTTLTCAISGGSATTCNDTTHSFTPASGDALSVKTVVTGTPIVGTINLMFGYAVGTSGVGVPAPINDTYANIVATTCNASNAGQLGFPTDSVLEGACISSAWQWRMNGFKRTTPPAAASGTWGSTQGGAVIADAQGGLFLTAPTNSGDQYRFVYNFSGSGYPGSSFTWTLGMLWTNNAANYNGSGMCISDGTALQAFVMGFDSTQNNVMVTVYSFTNQTTFSAAPASFPAGQLGPVVYLTYTDDLSATRSYYISNNPFDLQRVKVYSVSRTSFLTPTRIGPCVNANNTSNGVSALYFHWSNASI